MKLFIGSQRHRLNLYMSLCFSSSVSLWLVLFRIFLTSRRTYLFLVWNLFLAWIPFMLSQIIEILDTRVRPKPVMAALFFMWLIFFPNCPYIITDFIHFGPKYGVPMWLDLILIFSFVWNGLILGYISLLDIHNFLDRRVGSSFSWLIVTVFLFLSSFGIYLGRYERWNSWDVFRNPIGLLSNIYERIINPLSDPKTIGITFIFSLFQVASYVTLVLLLRYLSMYRMELPGERK